MLTSAVIPTLLIFSFTTAGRLQIAADTRPYYAGNGTQIRFVQIANDNHWQVGTKKEGKTEKLSAKKKASVIRLYLSGLSYDEIAAKTGVSKGTVANIVAETS